MVSFWAVMLHILTNTLLGLVTLSSQSNIPSPLVMLSSHLDSSCPLVTLNCSAFDLRATTIRWFVDSTIFAFYSISRGHTYPRRVDAYNATYDSVLEGVNIMVLSATQNENNLDVASFLSTMRVNISALLMAEVSTIDCGSFGVRSTVNVSDLVQVLEPQTPAELIVELRYNKKFLLTAINVQWNVIDSVCSVDYRVALLNSEREVITDESVPLDKCNSSICLISVPVPLSENFSIEVTSTFLRLSSLPISSATIYDSIESHFGVMLSNDACVASAKCFTTINDVDNCSIQYSWSSSEANTGQVFRSVNSSSQFPLVENSTQYFIRATFMQNTNRIILNNNFTIANMQFLLSFLPLADIQYTHTSLLVISCCLLLLFGTGVVLIAVAVVIAKRNYCHNIMAKNTEKCCISVGQCVVFIWALVIFISLFAFFTLISAIAYAGLQPDTCNSDRMRTSNDIFISAFSFVIITLALAVVLLVVCCLKLKVTTNHRAEELWSPSDRSIVITNDSAEEISSPSDQSIVFGDFMNESNEWVSNKKYAVCQVCKTNKVKKFFRHHCKLCNKLICGDCSRKKKALNGKKQRICDVCYYGGRVNKYCIMARHGQVQLSGCVFAIKFCDITKLEEIKELYPKELGWLEMTTKGITLCICVLSGKFRIDLLTCLRTLTKYGIVPKQLKTHFYVADTAKVQEGSRWNSRLLVVSFESFKMYKYKESIKLDKILPLQLLSSMELANEYLGVTAGHLPSTFIIKFDTVDDKKEWATFLKKLEHAERLDMYVHVYQPQNS